MNGTEHRLFRVGNDGSEKGDNDSSDVNRKLELQKLLDRVVDTSTPDDGLDNGSERVVHNDNVGSFLGNFSTGDTHGETNVGPLQSGSIVGTITGDSNNVAQLHKSVDQDSLVFRRRSSHDGDGGSQFESLRLGELSESRAFDDDRVGDEDTALLGDRGSGNDVVTSAHLDLDTGTLAVDDGLDDTTSEGLRRRVSRCHDMC